VPPPPTGPTGRVTPPTVAATPTLTATPGGGGGGNHGNGNGNGGGKPTQTAVTGRKGASPAGDGRSTVDVVPAAGATAAPAPPTTGSPDGTSSVTSDTPDPSSTGTTTSPGADDPDLADPPADDAMPGSWRIAALAALFVLGLAVALLIAAARPRGGAHRRH
jgi:hypothetical protein